MTPKPTPRCKHPPPLSIEQTDLALSVSASEAVNRGFEVGRRSCVECGKAMFVAAKRTRKYCSSRCQLQAQRKTAEGEK